MQNLGVNVFSFLFVSIYLFLVPRSINYVFIIYYLLFLLRTLYEPSSETQILTMVYNNTLIAKEMFKLSFFLSAMRFSTRDITRLGRLFQTCSFKTAKTGFNRFCPCNQKLFFYFLRILNAKRFWKSNIFEYAIYWTVGVNKLKPQAQTGGTGRLIRNSLFYSRNLCPFLL